MKKKDELINDYLKIAKRANNRLRKLEKLSNDPVYSKVKSWSYRKAMKAIKQMGFENKRSFPTNSKYLQNTDYNTIKKMTNDISDFLKSETSTKRGIDRFYKNRADTLNKKFGINLRWDEVGDFFENGGYFDLMKSKNISSDTAMRLYGVFQKNPKEIEKIVKDYNKKHKYDDKIGKEIEKLKGNKLEGGAKILDEKNLKKVAELLTDNNLSLMDMD